MGTMADGGAMTAPENTLLERALARYEKNAFMRHCGITIREVDLDHAVVELTLGPAHKNPAGMAHGGITATMVDCAAGTVTHADGRRYVTLDMNVRYLAGSAEGTLRAEAVVRQRGRTITLTDVAITDETGRLIVSASCSYYCVERQ